MLSEGFVQELRRFLGKGKVLDQMLNNVMKTGDINVQDRSGDTALIWAAYKGYEEMVEFLLRNGANPNLCDVLGDTALEWSTIAGYVNITKLLIEYGADVNVQDNYGYTPLINSSFRGNVSLVKILLKNGADISIKDNFGSTALDYVVKIGDKDIEDILRNPDKYISEVSREVECVSRLEEFKKIRKRVFR